MEAARLLAAAHRAMHIDEISTRLGRLVTPRELASCNAVTQVDTDTWQYNKQWQHVVDKESMCLLLQGAIGGIAIGDLKQCYADACHDVDELVKHGFVTVLEDKLFYSHPEYLLPIGEELLHAWHLAVIKEEPPAAPKTVVNAKKSKQHKRAKKVDKHNRHVSDLW